jgi:drug/metabolite transporter (DMT)-like permease
MKNKDRTALRATLAAVFCHSFWGLSFLASRKGLDSAHVFVLLSHRFLISFLVMHCFPRQVGRLREAKGVFLPLLALGMAQPVIYFFGEQYGILHSTTSFSGVMIAMIPVASTLAAWPLLKERPTAGQLVFSLLSVGGVIGIGLMSGSSGALDGIGVAALLVAVAAAAAYTLLSRRISARTSPFTRTYAMMAVGALVFTALALIQCRGSLAEYFRPLGETPYLLSVLFLSLLCSVVSFFLSGYALTRLPVARETVFSNLTTAVSFFAGVVILREPFSWLSLVCILLILAGIYGVQRTAPKNEAQSFSK